MPKTKVKKDQQLTMRVTSRLSLRIARAAKLKEETVGEFVRIAALARVEDTERTTMGRRI